MDMENQFTIQQAIAQIVSGIHLERAEAFHVMADIIKRFGGNPRPHKRRDMVQHFGGKPARLPHPGEILRCVDDDFSSVLVRHLISLV